MSNYPSGELNDYEFKIVRANWGMFARPEKFKQLLQEEAQAGWELVEKFDSQRVRFKRPISLRAGDSRLPAEVDPYRTQYGMRPMIFALLLALIILVVFLVFASLPWLIAVLFN